MERLDKFLCGSGAGTRSQVKDILKAGRVTVDGNPEKDGSRKIDPAVHTVTHWTGSLWAESAGWW